VSDDCYLLIKLIQARVSKARIMPNLTERPSAFIDIR